MDMGVTDQLRVRKALTRALNRMYTPLGESPERVEWTEDQVIQMDFEQLTHEKQRALVIVYSPRANPSSDEALTAIDKVIDGAREVISIINRMMEAEI